ncbi:MAG: carbohydrate binding family 9 domain-containing protein [Ferruginibacter sp.]|nr:carbohydrate binding family 9 domain-containing protein [Cytophagales bacterium]
MKVSFLWVGLFLTATAFAQPPPGKYALGVSKTDSTVLLDGALSESVWQRADVAKDFILNFPNDTARALNRTEVRMTYDERFVYVAVVCYDDMRKPFIATSLKRDFDWDFNDNLSVYLDPFGDGVNGFSFYVTPYGVEREGQMYNGEEVATEWDNKWRSAVKVYGDRWVGEMAIPFKTLRYKGNTRQWKMNFARQDVKNNQRSSWVPVPIAYSVSSLAFTGQVNFAEPLPNPGINISLIPYLTGRTTKSFEEGKPFAYRGNAGFDAKVAITPSLNLDVTVNPDFSQVEVDQQVTNLDRFEIFFPERRQFFLENSDLFDSFGFGRIRPFFSRRIGIGRDTLTGQIKQNAIPYGLRLSGKLNKDWRVGLLNMQTAKDAAAGIRSQNYTVAAVQRQVFGRSNVGAIFINRQRSGDETEDRYTRLAGLDYNLQTADNKWTGKFFYHRSFQPNQAAGTFAQGSNLEYQSRNLNVEWNQEHVGRNYQVNDIGYVARRGHWRFNPEIRGNFYPKNATVLVTHGLGAELNLYTNLQRKVTDRELDVFYYFNLANTSQLAVGGYDYYNYLFSAFDPTNSGGTELPEGSEFHFRGVFLEYTSNVRKRLNGSVGGFTGGYYNGKILSVAPRLSYRFQPYAVVSLAAEYNRIRLPEPHATAEFWLLGPRVDVSFTRSVFLTTFLQYNEQADNVNLNARLQWRFKPVSDLFVVYSDNYYPGSMRVKSRALVIKLSYWLNL